MTYEDKASYDSTPPGTPFAHEESVSHMTDSTVICETDSTENASTPKSTKSKNSDSSVSRGANSNEILV